MSKLRNIFRIATTILLLAAACGLAAAQPSAQTSTPVEQGKFILHKFEQPIGEETYEIRRDGDSLAVQMDFRFTDRARSDAAEFRNQRPHRPHDFH
jgi:hypothetical protein